MTKGTAARTHLTCLPWALSQVSQSSGARLSLLEATESLCHKHQWPATYRKTLVIETYWNNTKRVKPHKNTYENHLWRRESWYCVFHLLQFFCTKTLYQRRNNWNGSKSCTKLLQFIHAWTTFAKALNCRLWCRCLIQTPHQQLPGFESINKLRVMSIFELQNIIVELNYWHGLLNDPKMDKHMQIGLFNSTMAVFAFQPRDQVKRHDCRKQDNGSWKYYLGNL